MEDASHVTEPQSLAESELQQIEAPFDGDSLEGVELDTADQEPPVFDFLATATSSLAKRIAQSAYQEARRRNTVGYCYAGVATAVNRVAGTGLHGMSAYMAADQLARSRQFREVRVAASQLPRLPAGAIVVWGKTRASPHGHISVALGDGREASDHVSRQLTSLRGYTNVRVFLPSGATHASSSGGLAVPRMFL